MVQTPSRRASTPAGRPIVAPSRREGRHYTDNPWAVRKNNASQAWAITTADIRAYVAHRQQQGVVAVKGQHKGKRVADVSNGEVNRELSVLKRMFSLATQDGTLLYRPH